MNIRTLINVTACVGSTIIFAAREGWINSSAPICNKQACQGRNTSSYCYKRTDKNAFYWRFRCCRRRQSLLHGSMFFNGNLPPENILLIIWKISSRTPTTMIPRLIYGRPTSAVYERIKFVRDVVGW